jgi:Plasmid pRiA4b ORF-3-like protein
MKNIIQLKITLNGSNPVIWRRFQVHKTITIYGLHDAIQTVMGWDDFFLFGFMINGIPFDERSNKTIGSQIKEVGQKFEYTYDFINDWESASMAKTTAA